MNVIIYYFSLDIFFCWCIFPMIYLLVNFIFIKEYLLVNGVIVFPFLLMVFICFAWLISIDALLEHTRWICPSTEFCSYQKVNGWIHDTCLRKLNFLLFGFVYCWYLHVIIFISQSQIDDCIKNLILFNDFIKLPLVCKRKIRRGW